MKKIVALYDEYKFVKDIDGQKSDYKYLRLIYIKQYQGFDHTEYICSFIDDFGHLIGSTFVLKHDYDSRSSPTIEVDIDEIFKGTEFEGMEFVEKNPYIPPLSLDQMQQISNGVHWKKVTPEISIEQMLKKSNADSKRMKQDYEDLAILWRLNSSPEDFPRGHFEQYERDVQGFAKYLKAKNIDPRQVKF